MSCPALFNLKSGRLQGNVSRKSNIGKFVFNQSHPNGQNIHARKPKAYSNKTFGQKNPQKTKYSHFQTITTNNSKHVSDFISNNTDSFIELLPNNTTHFPRHQAILTFQRVTGKQYYTLSQSLYQAIMTFSESSFQIKL